MRPINVITIILLLSKLLYAQAPELLWTHFYDKIGNECANSIRQTSDGGFILAGYIYDRSIQDYDVWLIKTDETGDTLWTRTFGGEGEDIANAVEQTTDGGYIITGSTKSYGAGYADLWLIKTDSMGNMEWNRTFGGTSWDGGNSVWETSDGGYMVAGNTYSFGAGGTDFWLIKTNSLGDTLWSRTIGGESYDVGNSLQVLQDGGFVVIGSTTSFGSGGVKFWLFRADSSGDTLWNRAFEFPGGGSGGYSVRQTNDGGYIMVGNNNCGFECTEIMMIRTDSVGDSLWTHPHGRFNFDGVVTSVMQKDDGGFIMAGIGEGITLLIGTNELGDSLWTESFGVGAFRCNYSLLQTPDGGFMLAGGILNDSTWGDAWLAMFAPEVISVEPAPGEFINRFALSQNYPNPFNPSTLFEYSIPLSGNVSLIIYDLLGREIERLVDYAQPAGSYKVSWDASNVVSGIYFYRLQAADFVQIKKMILIR